jgi:hypothetical protein
MLSAKEDPECREAFLSILAIGRKYSEILHEINAASVTTNGASKITRLPFQADAELSTFLQLAKSLAARLCSGYELDALLDRLHTIALDVVSIPVDAEGSVKACVSDSAQWVHSSLTLDGYVQSMQGADALGGLYIRTRELFNPSSGSKIATDLRVLGNEIKAYTTSVSADRTMRALISSLDELRIAVTEGFSPLSTVLASEARHQRQALIHDFFLWLLPRLLSLVTSIPFPRVEYVEPTLETVLDTFTVAPMALSTSLLPDHIQIATWNEIRVDNARPEQGVGGIPPIEVAERLQIRVDGIRFAAEGLGYLLRYKPLSWLGYEDRGLLSVFVGGGSPGQGMMMDVSLSLNSDNRADDTGVSHMFSVDKVDADIPGLRFSLDRTHHWILNTLFVQPLAGSAVRLVLSNIIREQVTAALGSLSSLLAQWHSLSEAERARGEASLWLRYYYALVRLLGTMAESDGGFDSDDEPEDITQTTQTAFSTTGVTLTTIEEPVSADGDQETPRATVVAVGLAPQVLLDAAGPDDSNAATESRPHASAGIVVQRAQEELQEAENGIASAVDRMTSTLTGVAEIQKSAERGFTHGIGRRTREGSWKGWRSDAFSAD